MRTAITATLTLAIATHGLAPSPFAPAHPSTGASISAPALPASARAAAIRVKLFWSSIIRAFITISRHAGQRMAQYRISDALIKNVLSEGKVIYRANGITKVRSGGVTVVVNSKTGNVITVTRAGGGGGGGGL
jgi:hypothetical protein